MKSFKAILILCIASIGAFAHSVVLSNMTPKTYNAAVGAGTGHGGTFGSASVRIESPYAGARIERINSITFHNFKAQTPNALDIRLGGGAFQALHQVFGGSARIEGTITFRAGVSQSLWQKIYAGGTVGDSDVTPYEGRGAVLPPIRDFRQFEGTEAGWDINVINSSQVAGGSFDGVSMDVDLMPVPEPATLLILGMGALLARRRRR